MNRTTLIVFARAPIAGAAKTRLIPALGAEGAAGLHRALTERALTQAAASRPERLELWQADDDTDGFLAALAERHGAVPRRQYGEDLGARMRAALAEATTRGHAAMIMGTDCPELCAERIAAAAEALVSRDAVIVPARDGGYVLLGLHRSEPRLFADVPWGTGEVLAATRARLSGLGWTWRELGALDDIDRPDDLELLARLGADWSAWATVTR